MASRAARAGELPRGAGAAARIVQSDEWKRELAANAWNSDYLRSVETRKFLERETTEMRAFLTELGMVK